MFFAVFASIVVWSLVIVVAMRVFNNCGFSFPKNKVTDFLLAEKRITLKEETDGNGIRKFGGHRRANGRDIRRNGCGHHRRDHGVLSENKPEMRIYGKKN